MGTTPSRPVQPNETVTDATIRGLEDLADSSKGKVEQEVKKIVEEVKELRKQDPR